MNIPIANDNQGRSVTVGARVRIIKLPEGVLTNLPSDEQEELGSMLGEVFDVLEISENGYVLVEKEWYFPEEGHYMSHSLTLASNEIELVDE